MRSAWFKIVITVVIIVALGGLAYRLQGSLNLGNFSWSRLASEAAGARKDFLLASLATVYLAYLVRVLRWKRFCVPLGPCSLSDVWTGTMMGFTASFVFGRPAEPVRPLLLARKCRIAVSSMFGIYILERLFDAASAAVLAGASLLLFRVQFAGSSGGVWEARIRGAGLALLGGLVVFGLFLFYLRTHGASFMERGLTTWRKRGGWRGFVATQVAGFSDGLQAIRSFADWWAAVFYSALHWLVVVAVYWLIIRSFGGDLGRMTFSGSMLIVTFTMLGSIVQLPGVGGGAQLASFIALTKFFGIAPEPAAAAAVVTWLISFAGGCLIGVPLLIHEGLSMGDLRRLAAAETQAEMSGGHIALPPEDQAGSVRAREREDGAR